MKGHPGLFAPRSMLLATPRVEYSYSLVHYLRKCYDRNRANTKLTFDDWNIDFMFNFYRIFGPWPCIIIWLYVIIWLFFIGKGFIDLFIRVRLASFRYIVVTTSNIFRWLVWLGCCDLRGPLNSFSKTKTLEYVGLTLRTRSLFCQPWINTLKLMFNFQKAQIVWNLLVVNVFACQVANNGTRLEIVDTNGATCFVVILD